MYKDKGSLYLMNSRILTWKLSNTITNLPRIVSAAGCWLTGDNNKRYFDLTSQAVCCNLGYTVPTKTVKRISDQLTTLPFIYGSLASTPVVEELVDLVNQITPKHMSGFLFPSSGSEANEAAIRMARLYTGKETIISVGMSYHGGTHMSLATGADGRRNFLGKTGNKVDSVVLDHSQLSIDEICDYLETNGDTIAAFIFEPIIGSGGVHKHTNEWMKRVYETCKRKNIQIIADEVMAGFGRTGRLWSHELYGDFLKPDLMTFAKGFTGAMMPMSGVASSNTLHKYFQTNSIGYGSTYQAHPMAAVMAIETINRIRSERVINNVNTLEPVLRHHMNELSKMPLFKSNFRLHGFFGCMEIAHTDNGEENQGIITSFSNNMQRNGIIHMFRPPLFHIAPPLVTTKDDLDIVFDRIKLSAIDTMTQYNIS